MAAILNCSYCKKYFYNRARLNIHNSVHHSVVAKQPCIDCGKVTFPQIVQKRIQYTSAALKGRSAQNSKAHRCRLCFKIFWGKLLLKCHYCNMPFLCPNRLNKHLKYHAQSTNQLGSSSSIEQGFQDGNSDKSQPHGFEINYNTFVQQPLQQVAYPTYYDNGKCIDCGEEPVKDSKSEFPRCADCQQKFLWIQKKLRACHLCTKSFSNATKLYAHIKSHNRNTAFTCNDCKKQFRDFLMIEIHKAAEMCSVETIEVVENPDVVSVPGALTETLVQPLLSPGTNNSHTIVDESENVVQACEIIRNESHGIGRLRSYRCYICHENFNDETSKYLHMITHSTDDDSFDEIS